MAGFTQQVENTPVWSQIQILLKGYVESLETQRFQDLQKLIKDAELAQQSLTAITSQVATKNTELQKIETDKLAAQNELVKLKEKKDADELEAKNISSSLAQLKADYETAKNNLQLTIEDEHKIDSEKTRLAERLGELDRNLAKTSQEIVNKEKSLLALGEKESSLKTNITSLELKQTALKDEITQSNLLIDEKQNKIKELKKEQADAEKSASDAKNNLKTVQEECKVQEAQARKELEVVQAEVQKERADFDAEKEAVEKEKLFIKNFNEVMDEKNRVMVYVKKQLVDMVTKLSMYPEADKQELKNILFLIEKL